MRSFDLIIAPCLCLVAITSPAVGQTRFSQELKQLQEKHAKELAIAVEPVNRRYRSELETMLRRATQANDLPTANQVNAELIKLGVATHLATEGSNVTVESLTKALTGTTWVWFGDADITFLADGKVQYKKESVQWPWKVTSAGHRIVEGMNKDIGTKFTVTFDKDLKTGTIEIGGRTRTTKRIAP
jgi:hypothetical protein